MRDNVVAFLVFEMHFLLTALVVTVLISSGSSKFVRRTVREYSWNTVSEHWLAHQKLDHFDPTNLSTWKQRYLVNEAYFKNHSGPIFLLIGGEGSLDFQWLELGAMVESAAINGALCIGLEHRFYGSSHPTPDLTVENLRYLSSEQALADIAYFISNMNTKYELTPKNKWVVFGGSYAGSLAAWARMKYPHLIHAAVSSSGPVLAKASMELGEFFRHITAQSSEQCADNIHQAALELANLLNQTEGSEVLTKTFNLCQPLDIKNVDDACVFTEVIMDSILNGIQYDGIVALNKLCATMNNGQYEILERYALAAGFGPEQCREIGTFKNRIDWLMNTSYGQDESRKWFYQTCTEFGFYTTASSRRGFFGSDLYLPYYIDTCRDVFGDRFNQNLLNEGIKRTNLIYGGLNIEVTRVVFVQGSLDAWSTLGIKNSKPDAPAIVINGATHCTNMQSSSPYDSPALKDARKEINDLISKWLSV